LTNSEVKHENGAELKSSVTDRDPKGTFFFFDLFSRKFANMVPRKVQLIKSYKPQ